MFKKHKKSLHGFKLQRILIYLFQFFKVIGCVSISAFASLVGIPISIVSSVAGLKTCVITAGIKKYKTITMKKRKKHNKRVLLAKEILSYKLAIEVSIY